MRFICQIHPFSCARICAIRLKVYFLYAKRKQSKWNIVQANSGRKMWWKVTMKMHNYSHPQCDCIENGFDFCHFPMYVECCTWACDMLAQGANTLTKCLLNRAMLVSFKSRQIYQSNLLAFRMRWLKWKISIQMKSISIRSIVYQINVTQMTIQREWQNKKNKKRFADERLSQKLFQQISQFKSVVCFS